MNKNLFRAVIILFILFFIGLIFFGNYKKSENKINSSCFIIKTYKIQGNSLFPLLNNSEKVLLLEGYYNCNPLQRGDIIAEVDYFPLIIMTSNGEREFPPAFLRRCIHLTMQPRREFIELENIISNHIVLDEEKRAKLKEIIEEFIHKDIESEYLSIDQLLNAVFLKLEGVEILDKDNEPLLKSIWKSLSV